MDISQIYENLFVLFYFITISMIAIILGNRAKKISDNMNSTWFIFYTVTVLFISIPIALIAVTIVTAILMYII